MNTLTSVQQPYTEAVIAEVEATMALGIKNPFNSTTQLAGKDWLMGFLKRHLVQATNIIHTVGFNKPLVERFYSIYRELIKRYEYKPSKIWNIDETGIMCVHRPEKIMASKGVREVAKITCGERGKTVTVISVMIVIGYLPPLFIFPAKVHGRSTDERRATLISRICNPL